MGQYLLSTYAVGDEVQGGPSTADEMQEFMQRVMALEAEMDESGVFMFGGRLHRPAASTVVSPGEVETIITDGPFVESKEHIAGFYIIEADDLDDALAWTQKVVDALGHSIELRPFSATGRVADHMKQMGGS